MKKIKGDFSPGLRKAGRELERLLYLHAPMFAKGKVEISILLSVIRRTIGFYTFEIINTRAREFEAGYSATGYVGCMASNTAHYQLCRRDLIRRKIIYSFPRRDNFPPWTIRSDIRLNALGMMRFIVWALADRINSYPGSDRDGHKGFIKIHAKAKDICDMLEGYWEMKTWNKDSVVPAEASVKLLKDSIQKGRDYNEASRKRKIIKKLIREDFKESYIPELIRGWCEETGLKFNPQWSGKTWGQAKNFINECITAGTNPKVLLKRMVQDWDQFCMGVIKSKVNRPVIFPDRVDFSEFYKHRMAIMDWWASQEETPKEKSRVIHKDLRKVKDAPKQPEYTFKTIDLRKRREEG